MNFLIILLLGFALLGLVDKILGGKLHLAEEFDKGLNTMGALAVSMLGVYSFSVLAGGWLSKEADKLFGKPPFDPSIYIGSLLAPDLGAFAIAGQIARTPEEAVFSGILLSSMLGTVISFSLPIALSSIVKEETGSFMQGMVYGIVTIPAGLLVGGLLLGMPFENLGFNLLPIVLVCGLLCLALIKARDAAIKVFSVLGVLIRGASILLFGIVVVDIFFDGITIVTMESVTEGMMIIFRICITVCGSYVLSKILLERFRRQFFMLSQKTGLNEVSILGLFFCLISSIPMFVIFKDMDRKGKLINAAFSVSGAFVFGGQLAFVSSVTGGAVPAYLVAKLVGGVTAILLLLVLGEKKKRIPEPQKMV